MPEIFSAIVAFATHVSPAIVALVWARLSSVPRVKTLMIIAAKLIVITFTSVFLFGYAAEALCDGSALKGFSRCTLIPVGVARLSFPFYILSIYAVAAGCLGAAAIGIWAEVVAYRERRARSRGPL